MAGRTLHEVATGNVPVPGEQVDLELLWDSRVSQPVADTIDGLCSGSFTDVQQALKYLHKRAAKRVPTGIASANPAAPAPLMFEDLPPRVPAPSARTAVAVAPVVAAPVVKRPAVAKAQSAAKAQPAATAPPTLPFTPVPKTGDPVLPPRKKSWLRRMFGG
jgi:hypothetical protein